MKIFLVKKDVKKPDAMNNSRILTIYGDQRRS